jgi:octopine/nopaline transport system substrate-binding protein
MTLIRTLAAAALGLAALAGPADAQQQRLVRIATEGAYAPWNFTAPGGGLQGFEIDLANDLCRRMNVRCEIMAQDWDGIIPGLNAGRYDAIMAGMNITDRRLEAINFSRPYAAGAHAFGVMPNSPLRALPGADQVFNLTNQEADAQRAFEQMRTLLRGRTVGVQTATINAQFIERYFKDVVTMREYRTTEEHDLDLANGRLDAIFVAISAMTATAEKPEFRGLGPVGPRVSGGVLGRGVAVGIRKADNDLVTMFNTAIQAALADGTVRRLSEQWFKVDMSPRS